MLSPLLAGLTILIIGDSHLAAPGYLITTLHDDLVRQGAQVRSIGVCGSNAADWTKKTAGSCGGAERTGGAKIVLTGRDAHTAPIGELIAADKPDLVLVVLGDTMAGYKNQAFPKTWVWQQTTQLTKAIAATGTACAWIGPSWGTEGGKYNKTFARVQQMAGFLKNNVSPCTYIDSLAYSKPGQWPTTDGQHYTNTGYQAWGDALAKAVADLPSVKSRKP